MNWQKMKNELSKEELLEKILEILDGIDKDELESTNGWWENSSGADFGKYKKAKIIELFKNEITKTPQPTH